MFSLFTGACNRIQFFFLFASLTIFVGFFSRPFAPPAHFYFITTYHISLVSFASQSLSKRVRARSHVCIWNKSKVHATRQCICLCLSDAETWKTSRKRWKNIQNDREMNNSHDSVERRVCTSSIWPNVIRFEIELQPKCLQFKVSTIKGVLKSPPMPTHFACFIFFTSASAHSTTFSPSLPLSLSLIRDCNSFN